VPDNEVSKHLAAAMGTPLISISARDSSFVGTTDELLAKLLPVVDVAIVSDDYTFVGESTVLDLTSDVFSIIREGAGIEEVMAYMPEEAE
jgi:tRNA A37 threonylcarbamoyladenosine synthetase subunit TsaC/SUA5/YrdC